jgi:hypothetical protein
MKNIRETILLLLILAAGAFLRFHNLGEISFSNDELSALTRARHDSFHELVDKGIKVDGHPAFVQTMIWFTIQNFSDDVFKVRLPFALAGTLSILLVFLLAKRWFGSATGLLSAAALATLQFPLLYSQIARPYSIGLFFTLALAYCWTLLLFDDRKKNWVSIAYVIACAGCIYTHYFSFMLAGIIGITGLFFLRKDTRITYLLCNIIPLLFFIPSISIFRQQFGYEGIGGWLPPPDNSFLARYIFYGFNESWLITIFFSLFLLAVLRYRDWKWKLFHSVSLAWYFVPLLIGYSYSVWKAPVLQFSTLLFSFPFLLIFIFSFVSDSWMPKKIITALTLSILALGTFSTVAEKKYYQTNHFGVFKELAEKSMDWDEKYGSGNVIRLFSLSNPEYLRYYFRKLDHAPGFTIYTDDERTKYGTIAAVLDTAKAAYFAYGWTNAHHAYETPVLIREKYPVVVERRIFFNSEITLFGKGNAVLDEKIISETGFEKNNWENETERQSRDVAHSGIASQKMDAQTEYSISFKTDRDKLIAGSDGLLKAETWFYPADSLYGAALVIAFVKNDALLSYSSMPLKNFYFGKSKWTRAFLYSKFPGEKCEVRIYVWNPDHEIFYIDDLSVKIAPDHGLFNP